MKKLFSIGLFLLILLNVLPARAITPFFIKLANATNATSAQQIGVTLLTPAGSSDTPFSVYGTNLIFGGNATTNFTISLDGSGYSSNAYFPGTYKFVITNLNAAFIAVIPDTTNFLSVTAYVTNLQVFPGVALNSYGNATNLLGFAPATNTLTGIVYALGYTPVNPSNLGTIASRGSNDFHLADGFIGASGLSGAANLSTNGFLVMVAYKTNGLPGSAFTNLPTGSILTTTNGGFYVLSNLLWIAH